MKELNLDYNSTYISLNLIDELDYIIGGYGKPDIVFLYTLNSFIESFILNSIFYVSDQELKHAQIVSKTIFPNGRPILEMLSRTGCLKVIMGIGNNIGTVVSIGQTDPNKSYQETITDFINNKKSIPHAKEKYLRIASLDEDVKNISFINIGKVDDGFIAVESKNSPEQFYQKINEITFHSNVQAVLPFYSYEFQINEIPKRGIGKDIISKLTESYNINHSEINSYLGYKNQQIPPLVSILLGQCEKVTEISTNLFQLRDDFTNLRNSIVKYEKRIAEADTMKDQLDAINEINSFWEVFNKKYSTSSRILYNFWEIAESSEYEKSIDNIVDNESLSKIIEDFNIGKVVGKSAKKTIDYFREKKVINRFRGVSDLSLLFKNTPNIKDHFKNYEKIFDTKIESDSLSKLQTKLSKIKTNNTPKE
ncbi:hypothetical protein [Flavobacterium anhuiense]|uniref:hypothetical protein n=1 Tax=Flavobacterium anhuiense TaxID=459526 RepID=UPI003D96CFB7